MHRFIHAMPPQFRQLNHLWPPRPERCDLQGTKALVDAAKAKGRRGWNGHEVLECAGFFLVFAAWNPKIVIIWRKGICWELKNAFFFGTMHHGPRFLMFSGYNYCKRSIEQGGGPHVCCDFMEMPNIASVYVFFRLPSSNFAIAKFHPECRYSTAWSMHASSSLLIDIIHPAKLQVTGPPQRSQKHTKTRQHVKISQHTHRHKHTCHWPSNLSCIPWAMGVHSLEDLEGEVICRGTLQGWGWVVGLVYFLCWLETANEVPKNMEKRWKLILITADIHSYLRT